MCHTLSAPLKGGWEGKGAGGGGRGEKHLQSNSSAAAMDRKLSLTCV